MQLENGSRVVIIGGGPAGSFAALHLLSQATHAGLDLRVSMIEPRDFSRPGLGGCNKCAGILSSQLVRNLARLDLQIPPDVVQSEIDTYILHNGSARLPIHIDNPQRKVISVYRGGGPRLGSPPLPRSFDAWLLGQAVERGAQVLKTRALSVQAGSLPGVSTPAGELECELLILASGVNGRVKIDPRLGYSAPRTEVMAQDEIPCPGDEYRRQVHIFFDQPKGLVFGALIPKNRYVNISLLGHGLPADAVKQFLQNHALPELSDNLSGTLCGCAPHIAVSAARGYFHDRFAAVGDAAVTRLYKDGIGSAFLTAEAAALSAVQRGISRADFAAGFQSACQAIRHDNFYGHMLFKIWSAAREIPAVRKAWGRAVLSERELAPARRPHTDLLWGMLSGDASYRSMFWQLASIASLSSILRRLAAA